MPVQMTQTAQSQPEAPITAAETEQPAAAAEQPAAAIAVATANPAAADGAGSAANSRNPSATADRDPRGLFQKGNRAHRLAKTPDIKRAQLRRHKVARILSEALTERDIKAAVKALVHIIKTGAARDQISAFRALMDVAASRPTSGDSGSVTVLPFGFILPPVGVIPQNARLSVQNEAAGPMIIDASDGPMAP